jgi:hypothetical protein
MMDHHISNNIRHKVLRELAGRIQNVISDVLSPWYVNLLYHTAHAYDYRSSNPVSSTLEFKIRRLLALFEEPGALSRPFSLEKRKFSNRSFLFLRPDDVLTLAKSLCPDGYTESSRNSVFEQPSSSSSSVMAYSGAMLPGMNDPPLFTNISGNTIQNHTWHGGRPNLVDTGYHTFDRNINRPGSSGALLVDPEKETSLPFTHDLWMLTASRDFQLPGSIRQEVAVLFINEHSFDLSLDPFETGHHTPRNETSSDWIGLTEQDRLLVAAGLTGLAEANSALDDSIFQNPFISLEDLKNVFEGKASESKAQFDFQSEYFWWRCLQVLQNSDSMIISSFLNTIVRQRNARVDLKRDLSRQYDDWLHALRNRSTLQDQMSQKISLSSKRLRNKMWFVSDVKHSSAYEDALNVVRALKAMVEPYEQRQTGVAAWAKQRFRNSFGQERVLSQTLELMTAPKTYGGPNKLSESQVEITSGWLLHENIENFCRGEERIHRFCYEVQKCVKRLAGEAMLDSPVLWSSPLYQSEKTEHGIASHSGSRHGQDRASWRTDFSYPQWSPNPAFHAQPPFVAPNPELQPNSPSSIRSSFENTLHAPFQQMGTSPQNFSGAQVPRNWMLPPSPISPGNVKTSNDGASLRRRSFLQNLRTHLTSLLLSDLGPYLWSNGSETDRYMAGISIPTEYSQEEESGLWTHPEPTNFRISNSSTAVSNLGNFGESNKTQNLPPSFLFSDTYKVILQRFKLSPNPQAKLQYLHELFLLAGYASRLRTGRRPSLGFDVSSVEEKRKGVKPLTGLGVGVGVARTRLTRLQEVAANCEDRRLGSIANSRSGMMSSSYGRALPTPDMDDPELVAMIREIFADPAYRPSTFFRDLQYIASFTPSSTLDYTPQGTAFWTIGLAAMKIKSDRCKSMTDDAMQILEFHYGNGDKKEPIRVGQSSPGSSGRKLSQRDLSGTTLRDAAQLLTISALEGDPTAARELALFHLTQPELVSRVTLPLSRPSDVFRAKHGSVSERNHRNANDESPALDPITFAVVFHWMEFAANAGDTDAINFFKENKDLGKAL